jgi:hypothetical protein
MAIARNIILLTSAEAAALFREIAIHSIHLAYPSIDDGYWTATPNPHLNERIEQRDSKGAS